jgi:hypothetical protein
MVAVEDGSQLGILDRDRAPFPALAAHPEYPAVGVVVLKPEAPELALSDSESEEHEQRHLVPDARVSIDGHAAEG